MHPFLLQSVQVSGFSERTTWVRDPPKAVRVNKEQIVESVERSLQRLGTDHIGGEGRLLFVLGCNLEVEHDCGLRSGFKPILG